MNRWIFLLPFLVVGGCEVKCVEQPKYKVGDIVTTVLFPNRPLIVAIERNGMCGQIRYVVRLANGKTTGVYPIEIEEAP